MRDSSPNLPVARSWRDIRQEVKPRAMSKSGRRRHAWAVTQWIAGTVVVGGLIWAGVALVDMAENKPQRLAQVAQSESLNECVLETDGVLDRGWLMRTLALPKGVTLLELDLGTLQSRLLADRQVRTAVLSKSFPSTLVVTITERAPVARVMAQLGAEPPREFLVSRDGVAYAGAGYARELCDSLPWLAGVKLVRAGNGFAPIGGMDLVADFLGKAKYEAEHLYRNFKIVSLEKLDTDGDLVVRMPDITEVVFSARDDFFRQLAKLDSIRDVLQPHPESPLPRLDLSHGREVPVTMGAPAGGEVPAGAPEPSMPGPVAPLQLPKISYL